MVTKLTSIIIAIIGIAMLYMGGQLIAVGGSPFYAILAVGLLLTAILLFMNKKIALSVYAILMWITLAWIIWEAGFDKWQWIPRGDVIGLIGLWLAMPFIVRPLTRRRGVAQGFHPFLGTTVVVMIAIVIGLFFYDPYPQKGTLTNERQPADTEVAKQDWAAYGGNDNGQRFSALNQITKDNVKNLELAWQYQTGDVRDPKTDASEYTFEATPLKVNDTLYFCTPQTKCTRWSLKPAS